MPHGALRQILIAHLRAEAEASFPLLSGIAKSAAVQLIDRRLRALGCGIHRARPGACPDLLPDRSCLVPARAPRLRTLVDATIRIADETAAFA